MEMCRTCGQMGESFGHLIPQADGGPYAIWNVTIQCHSCNHLNDRSAIYLPSLLEEELYNPPGCRIAYDYYAGLPERPEWVDFTIPSIREWRENYYEELYAVGTVFSDEAGGSVGC